MVWDSVWLTPGCPWLQSMTELLPPSTPSPWLPLSSPESPPSPSRTPLRSSRPELPTWLLWRPPRPERGRGVRLSQPSSLAAPEFSPPQLPSSTTLQSSATTDWATTAITDSATPDSATMDSTVPTLATMVSTKQKYQNLTEL